MVRQQRQKGWGEYMNIEEMQKKCEEKALEAIKEGRILREIDMRMIVRQVLREELSGKKEEKE